MTIEEALGQLGIFQGDHPPLREHFSDWLVDALQDQRYERPRETFRNSTALRDTRHMPTWMGDANTLPQAPEEIA